MVESTERRSKTQVEQNGEIPEASDNRCLIGIAGLDQVLSGGLPAGCFYLVQGDPGAGKTTLALQFLLEGRSKGEKGLYITLSETREELMRVARSHDWSLGDIALLELAAIERLLSPEAQTTVFHSSELELKQITHVILDELRRQKPARIVFDSLSEFRLIAESALRYRRALLNLKSEFARAGSTVLLLDDKMDNQRIGADPHVLSLAHGVISMEQLSPDYGTSRRRLRVMKMRGVDFSEGFHDYLIEKGGIRVFPRLVAAEHRKDFIRQPVSSGLPELDDLFGGGLERGTTTLILGPAGSGKSSLTLQYASQIARGGERGLVFTFDETLGVMLSRAKELGLDLGGFIDAGLLTVQQIDPAEISPGEFAARIIAGVKAGCKLVIIDSLNGYLNSMPGEKYLNNQLHELTSYLNQHGVLTLMVLAQHGLVAAVESPVDLTYLADTVVSLRFFESGGEVKQALSIIKKRSGHHEKSIRELRLESGKGIRIGPPITEFEGILSGIPVFRGRGEQILKPLAAGG